MLLNVIKALLIGICSSLPLGPIAIFTLQKSLTEGRRAGFLTGLGAATVDTLYAMIAVFALAAVESWFNTHRPTIILCGGLLLIIVGASITFSNPFRSFSREEGPSYSAKDYLKSVLMGLSNPGAIFVMFALMAFFNVSVEAHDFRVAPIILGVSAGAIAFWYFFSWFFSKFKEKIKLGNVLWVNRASGILIMIIGIAFLADGAMQLIFT